MQFQQPFDPRTTEPTSFAPPPVLGDYHVRIIDSEGKPTKDNQGGYLELTLEILDQGPYAGRKIADRLNLFNTNPQTQAIAYGHLSAICHVTGFGLIAIQDSRQLHNIPFIATIGPQANNPNYSNVFGVKDLNGVAPGSKTTPAAGGPIAAPVAQPPAYAPPAAAAPAWAPPGPAAPVAQAAPPAAPAWAPPAAAAAAPPVWQPPPAGAPAAALPAKAPWER